ncbi:MAG TPA: DUF192 domain-containing protein [Candidatus Chromulinivoraceae bacterium]|nr:DUF192 domain-containing protein [Candidatus Chromulinivoraceae bacterium]
MSRRRDAMSWGVIALVLMLVSMAAVYVLWPQLQPHTTLHLGDGIFTAQVAKTQAARDKGLTGTPSLSVDNAMIFVYDTDGKWPINMKDMNFPIDIVWLNKDKQVIYIVKNVPPESYPYQQFAPKDDARYVVELAAGVVGQKSIDINATAQFDENNLQGIQF